MKAEQLLAFCSAAKYKNITQAADALGTSQPGLSRQLAALQDALGEVLYERTAYGIALTSAGEALLPYACAVAQTLTQARTYVRDKGSRLRVTLKVGLSHSLVPSLTPKLLYKMNELNEYLPNVKTKLTEGYSEVLIEKVLQRQLDAAFVVEPYSHPTRPLLTTPVGSEMIGLFVPEEHFLSKERLVK